MGRNNSQQGRVHRLVRRSKSKPLIQNFLIGFLVNYQRDRLLLELVYAHSDDNRLRRRALQQYIVFLIRSMESFFHNVFIYTCSVSDDFYDYHLDRYNEKISGRALVELHEGNIDIIDLLADQYNFQNLMSISSAFKPLFARSIFDHLGNTEFHVYDTDNGERAAIKLDYSWPTWRDSLRDLFEMRHEIIHNANVDLEITEEMIREFGFAALAVPQFMSLELGNVMKLPFETSASHFAIMLSENALLRAKDESTDVWREAINEARGMAVSPFVFNFRTIMKADFSASEQYGCIAYIIEKIGDIYNLIPFGSLNADGIGVADSDATQ